MRHSAAAPENEHRAWRIIGRIVAVIGITLLCLALLLTGATFLCLKGPSTEARDRFVTTVNSYETLKFLPRLFLTEDEIRASLNAHRVPQNNALTDTTEEVVFEKPQSDLKSITVTDIVGDGFTGKLLTVQDPTRVNIAYAIDNTELTVHQFTKSLLATAGINGGALVLQEGFPMTEEAVIPSVIAFDKDSRLIVGRLAMAEAEQHGIYDAISAGPALIIDGAPVEFIGEGSGLAPRAAVGQRADGAILMLVLDGYQPDSLGATYLDCAELMVKYGAVNAACTDNAAMLVYNDKIISDRTLLPIDLATPSALVVQ